MRLDKAARQQNYKKYLAKKSSKSLGKIKADGLMDKASKGLKKAEGKAKNALSKAADKLKSAGKSLIEDKTTTLTHALGVSKDVATSLGKGLSDIVIPDSIDVKATNNSDDENEETKVDVKKDQVTEDKNDLKKTEEEKKLAQLKKQNDEKRIEKIKERTGPKPVNKPALFFIKGMEIFNLSSDKDGLEEMAGAYSEAQLFEWDQKEEMLFEIRRRPKQQPIVLVGHSLGADTAIEIANELNQIEHKFRPVNLVVTLDAVGTNNDIIPKNVKRNINFITENILLGDHPNIARSAKDTKVENILSTLGHREVDNNTDIQSDIVESIDNALAMKVKES